MSATYHYLDLENWPRLGHFQFFKAYELPFFEMTAPVRAEKLYQFTKKEGLSFFHATLFLSLKAANETEPFRYRLEGDRVKVYETIHGGSTVLNENETFGFCYFDYHPSFQHYHEKAAQALQRHREGNPPLDAQDQRDDLIHYSVIPWVAFTHFSHATRLKQDDTVPKIVFGKYEENEGKGNLPVAVKVHHALMDGLHVGKFYEKLSDYFHSPQTYLTS